MGAKTVGAAAIAAVLGCGALTPVQVVRADSFEPWDIVDPEWWFGDDDDDDWRYWYYGPGRYHGWGGPYGWNSPYGWGGPGSWGGWGYPGYYGYPRAGGPVAEQEPEPLPDPE